MNTNKIARTLFTIVGCIMPIFIGVLHTATHFSDLVTPEIQEYLQKEVSIIGQNQPLWYTWGITSVMMGISFIVIGILNISMLRTIPKKQNVPILSICAMILYLIFVLYVGIEFEQAFQFYGAIFGLVLMIACLFLSLNSK